MRTFMTSLAALLLVTACGGEDDEGGLDSKKASELSDAEREELCEWAWKLQDASISDEQFCTQQASEVFEETEECEAERDVCLAEVEAAGEADEEQQANCASSSLPRACTATVGALKACLSDLNKSLKEASEKASCEDPAKGRVGELPASCEAIPEACLGLMSAL